jgi:BirA family biotin operon repressor/biotin-[acetyl-CoA-carboxylase] ligase
LPEPSPVQHGTLALIELHSIDSTNNYARQLIAGGKAFHGLCISSSEQTSGRGQRSRSWLSEKDKNILLSIILNPHPVSLSAQFHLTATIAVSMQQFFSKYAREETKIKWPNDLYWQDRKAGGMLVESLHWKWVIAGIGININQTFFDKDLANPVSLKQITGKELNVKALTLELASIVIENFKYLIENGFDRFYKEYNFHLYKKDQHARIKKDNRVFEAVIKSVNMQGNLIIQHAIEEEIQFGEIEWLPNS